MSVDEVVLNMLIVSLVSVVTIILAGLATWHEQ